MKLYRIEHPGLVDELFEHLSQTKFFFTTQACSLKLLNHIKGIKYIARKQLLAQNVFAHANKIKINPYDIIPKTFFIRGESAEDDLESAISEIEAHYSFEIPWIIKPGEFSNRGQGIVMGYGKEEVIKKTKKLSENRRGTCVLLQLYLNNPLLYKKRKFDIRCYALLIKMRKRASVYWYNAGYARTSSYVYNTDSKDNLMVHLTNEAVQIKSKKTFGKHEKGNKIYYRHMENYFSTLPEFKEKGKSFLRDIVPRMKAICKLSFQSTIDQIVGESDCVGFELLGFDFMIDRDLKVWLIEVNENPCLSTFSKPQDRLINKLVKDTLHLTVDPIFGFDLSRSKKKEEFKTNYELILQKFT